jgi:capsular polysaccharide biosynthesis protein
VNDPEYSLAWPDGVVSSLPGHLWVGDDFVPDDYPPEDVTGGLTSLRFITAAIRRRARLWCVTAAIGLIGGCAFAVVSPAPYRATASLLLTSGPYENVNTAQNNDQAMAQSRTVAGAAVRKLGLKEDPSAFLSSYSATPLTERVLQITLKAPSAGQAVAGANAVAEAFLAFRADQMQAQGKLILASLNQQISQAQNQINSLNSQIGQGPGSSGGGSGSSGGQSQSDSGLRTQRTREQTLLYNLQQSAIQEQTTIEPAIAASVEGSIVLDAAITLPHSSLKPLATDGGIGLAAGLMLGMGYVVILAIVSDRLRRRDDVAQALGAPVRLSIRAAQGKRGPSGRRGRRAAADTDVERIASHLARIMPVVPGPVVPGSSLVALTVVPVDDTRVPARSLVTLAMSLAREGHQIVMADLCEGAPAAALLNAANPGVHAVSTADIRLTVAVPGAGEIAPAGPFGRGSALTRRSAFTEAVTDACAHASTLLTLMTLDPSLGGEHIATWATDAVAMVTAGESSEVRIRAVGEMVRLSGARLVSAVLVGADKSDESLGVLPVTETA